MKGKKLLLFAVPIVLLIVWAGYLIAQKLTRTTDIPIGSDFSISLERTVCFGSCPVYRLTVEDDGTVTYIGEMFVAVEGEQKTQISRDKVNQIAHQLEAIDFFSLQDQYTDMGATDMPSAILTLVLNGKTKRVVHYHGDFSAPEKLTKFELFMDEITNSAQWIESTAP